MLRFTVVLLSLKARIDYMLTRSLPAALDLGTLQCGWDRELGAEMVSFG